VNVRHDVSSGPGARLRLRLGIIAAIPAVVVGTLLVTASPAAAHAGLIGSDPADGVVLAAPPHTMTLRFDEPVVVDQTGVDVREVSTGRSTSVRPDPAVGDEAGTVTFTLPTLGKGAYEVTWQTVSGSDRHTSSGVIVFGVGAPAPEAALRDPWPGLGDAVSRSASLIGLSGAVGSVLVLYLLSGRLADDPRRRSLSRTVATIGVSFGAVAAAGEIGLLVRAAAGASVGSIVTQTSYGQRWLAGFVASFTLTLWLALAARRVDRLTLIVAAALGLVAVAMQPLTTHLAVGVEAGIGSVVATLHLAAAGGWAGGLVVLTLTALRTWRRPLVDGETDAVFTAFVGFAWLALPSAALLVVTGLLLTGRQVATPDALLFTHYGRVLLLKVALVVVMGLFGLRHATRLRRRPAHTSDRPVLLWTIAGEAGLALLVLVAAGVLGGASPPRGVPWVVPPPVRSPAPVTSHADGLTITTTVAPGTTGANVLAVQTLGTGEVSRRPVLLVTADLAASTGAAQQVSLQPDATGNRWRAALDLPTPGTYRMVVTLARSGRPDIVIRSAWPIASAPIAGRPVDVSNAALGPILRWLAFAFLVGLAVAAAIVLALRPEQPTTGA